MLWNKIIGSGGAGGAAPELTVTYLDTLTTNSVSSLSIGDPDPTRTIVVVYDTYYSTTSGAVVSSITIGGVSSLQVKGRSNSNIYSASVAFGARVVPEGTTIDIVVNRSSATNERLHVFKITGAYPTEINAGSAFTSIPNNATSVDHDIAWGTPSTYALVFSGISSYMLNSNSGESALGSDGLMTLVNGNHNYLLSSAYTSSQTTTAPFNVQWLAAPAKDFATLSHLIGSFAIGY